jgi:hypothetical protein
MVLDDFLVLTAREGTCYKQWCKLMPHRGNDTANFVLQSKAYDSSIFQHILLTICHLKGHECNDSNLPDHIRSDTPRGCVNHLKSVGIPRGAWAQFPMIPARSGVFPNLAGSM